MIIIKVVVGKWTPKPGRIWVTVFYQQQEQQREEQHHHHHQQQQYMSC